MSYYDQRASELGLEIYQAPSTGVWILTDGSMCGLFSRYKLRKSAIAARNRIIDKIDEEDLIPAFEV